MNHSIPRDQRLPPPATTSGAALARSQAEAAVNEQLGTSSRFRFIAKDSETERITATEEDESGDDEEGVIGDEAEELLKDLQEQFEGSKGGMDIDEGEETDRKKRKRAEDLIK